jgi:hypothetical protein
VQQLSYGGHQLGRGASCEAGVSMENRRCNTLRYGGHQLDLCKFRGWYVDGVL